MGAQELRVFLEAEGALAASYAWQQLQPMASSILEGVARLPKQLLGAPPLSLVPRRWPTDVGACGGP